MPTLSYFDVGGRAEPMRLLCAHAKVEFEDRRLTFEEFGALKAEGKVDKLPLWTLDDGTVLNQSQSILRLLGSQNGYYPDDVMNRYYCDNVLDAVGDLLAAGFSMRFYKPEVSEEEMKS